jgi:hypothetical protein
VFTIRKDTLPRIHASPSFKNLKRGILFNDKAIATADCHRTLDQLDPLVAFSAALAKSTGFASSLKALDWNWVEFIVTCRRSGNGLPPRVVIARRCDLARWNVKIWSNFGNFLLSRAVYKRASSGRKP